MSTIATASEALYNAPILVTTSDTRDCMTLKTTIELDRSRTNQDTRLYLSLSINVSSRASFIRALRFFCAGTMR